jgi:hypothetical protein
MHEYTQHRFKVILSTLLRRFIPGNPLVYIPLSAPSGIHINLLSSPPKNDDRKRSHNLNSPLYIRNQRSTMMVSLNDSTSLKMLTFLGLPKGLRDFDAKQFAITAAASYVAPPKLLSFLGLPRSYATWRISKRSPKMARPPSSPGWTRMATRC